MTAKNKYKYSMPQFEIYKSLREPCDIDGYLSPALGKLGNTITIDNGYIDFNASGLYQNYSDYAIDWDVTSSWPYRLKYIFTQSTGSDLTNYPVRIEIAAGSSIYDDIQDDGDDIRFFDSSGTECDYWIEAWNGYDADESSYIWIEIPILADGDTSIYMYFGNGAASEQQELFHDVHYKRHYADSNLIACYHMDHHQQQALHSDGSDENINCGSDSSINGFTQMTFCAWIRAEGIGEGDAPRIMDKNGTSGKMIIYKPTQDCLQVYMGFDTTDGNWITDNDTIEEDIWYHIAVVYDNTSVDNDPVIYINGISVNVNESSTPEGSADDDTAGNFLLCDNAASNRCFEGRITDVRYFNTLLTATEVIQVMQGLSIQTDNLKLWLDMEYNGTAVYDLSGNGNNGTITGLDVQGSFLADCPTCGSGSYHGNFNGSGEPKIIGTDGIKFGANKALWLDGNDDYITLGAKDWSGWNPTTISFWVQFDTNADDQYLFEYYVDATHYMRIYYDSGDSRIEAHMQAGATSANSPADADIVIAKWTHVAVTFQAFSYLRLYIDGNEQSGAAAANLAWLSIGSATDVNIGNGQGHANALQGKIAKFRVWQHRLSDSEILSDMKGDIIERGDVEIYFNFKQISGAICYDQSGNNNDGTISGAIETLGDYPFTRNYCLEFDGTQDYCSNSTLLDVTPAGISISFWFKLDSDFDAGSTSQCIAAKQNVSLDDRLNILLLNGDGGLRFWVEQGNDGGTSIVTPQKTWAAGRWYHGCCTWDTTNGIRIYINGILEADDSSYTTLMGNGTATDFFMGIYWNGTDYDFAGRIDDFRVWSIGLSGTEVQQVMNGDTTIQSGNLLAYYTMQDISGSTLPDQEGNYDMTISGAIEVCDDRNIYDGNLIGSETINDCLEYDGADDKVSLGAVDFSSHTTGSISCWAYFKDDSEQYLFQYVVDVNNEMRLFFDESENQVRFRLEDGGVAEIFINSDFEPSANTWYHFVVVQNGTSAQMYINGIAQDHSGETNAGDWFDDIGAAATFDIGCDAASTNALNGYIDEFKVYNTALSADEVLQLYYFGHRFDYSYDSVSENIGSYIYNKIPIGNVPQIDGDTYHGNSYKIAFDFFIDSITTDGLAYICFINSDNYEPQILIEWDDFIAYTKLGIYIKDSSGTASLYFQAWDNSGDAWWYDGDDWNNASETSTGNNITYNKWYHCIIERKNDRYRIDVEEIDSTEVEESDDLYFDDFNGNTDYIKYSNKDSINGETGDYILLGAPAYISASQIRITAIYMSPPIEEITEWCANPEVMNAINEEIDSSDFDFSNISENGPLFKYKDPRWINRLGENDEIEVRMDYGDAEL